MSATGHDFVANYKKYWKGKTIEDFMHSKKDVYEHVKKALWELCPEGSANFYRYVQILKAPEDVDLPDKTGKYARKDGEKRKDIYEWK